MTHITRALAGASIGSLLALGALAGCSSTPEAGAATAPHSAADRQACDHLADYAAKNVGDPAGASYSDRTALGLAMRYPDDVEAAQGVKDLIRATKPGARASRTWEQILDGLAARCVDLSKAQQWDGRWERVR